MADSVGIPPPSWLQRNVGPQPRPRDKLAEDYHARRLRIGPPAAASYRRYPPSLTTGGTP